MKNFYSSFDALDRNEYDTLMEELMQNDTVIRRKAATPAPAPAPAPKFRYQLVIAWSDFSSKTESTNEISAALRAVEIYIEDRNCDFIHIYDRRIKRDVFNWNR